MKYALKATAIGLVPIAVIGTLFLSGYLLVVAIALVTILIAFAIGDSILASRKEDDEDKNWYDNPW